MKPSFVFTNEITLNEVPEYYDKLFYKKDSCVKVLVRVNPEASAGKPAALHAK